MAPQIDPEKGAGTQAGSQPKGNFYDKYGTAHPIERRLVRGFFASLEAALAMSSPRRVVEVGAGEGEIASMVKRRFPSAEIAGIDLPDPRLAAEWGRRGLRGVFADARALPVRDGSADLVVAVEVLEHVANPRQALSEIVRIASRTIILSVPREPIWRVGNLVRFRYVRRLGNTPGHINHWSSRQFVRLISEYADVEKVVRPFPWTLVVALRRGGVGPV